MNFKKKIIVMYAVLLLPMPISIMSWMPTIMFIGNIENMLAVDKSCQLTSNILVMIASFLASTYPITYGMSLHESIKNNKLQFSSYLPFIHLIVAFLIFWVFFNIWYHCEIY